MGGRVVLVAEDDELVRRLIVTVLQRGGYEVALAEDGEEAVQVFMEREAEIGLVILDAEMPRQSGLDALQAILAHAPGTPYFITSGHDALSVPGAEAIDDAHWLRKPYVPTTLIERVRTLLPDQPK